MGSSRLVPASETTFRYVYSHTLRKRQHTDKYIVTPGNTASAVVAGVNVILYSIIALLANRERLQKKRLGELSPASLASSTGEGSSEKQTSLADEEDISPVASPVRKEGWNGLKLYLMHVVLPEFFTNYDLSLFTWCIQSTLDISMWGGPDSLSIRGMPMSI